MTTATMPSAPQSGSGSHRSQNQQSPFKAARSSRSRVSTSCSSASSSSSGEEQSDSDCDVGRKKKHRRDKPRSDKNKTNTLIRIFNPKEGGAKKQGQVVIIDQSEEMLSKEQHHLQQQQQFHHQQQTQQKHISPNAAFKTSQENLAQLSSSSSACTTAPPPTSAATVTTHSSQSPRLTPGSMKSPRNLLPSQLLAHRTPDRSSSSAERKLHQRIKTPTRTPARTPPTTRTPTPTQQHMPGMATSALRSGTTTPTTAAGPSLICKIDLSRLKRIAPEWHTNSYRLYMPGGVTPTAYHHHTGAGPPSGRTPIYDHETILNADLQATQLRLKPSSRSGSTPRSTGSRTPTQAAVVAAAAAAAAAASDREMSRSRESLLDGGSSKQRLEDVHSNGRLSSRSTDGASTPKDLPPPQASVHLTPNGYTSSRGLSATAAAGGAGSGSPSTKLIVMAGVKNEHIKYEPDTDAYNDTKFKTSSGGGSGGGAAVKQELLIMKHDLKPSELAGLSEKNRIGSPSTGEMKPRRKRSSSSSSSPYKEKKRKKEKDSAGSGSNSATGAPKDKEKDKADRDGNKSAADRLITNNGQTQREMLLLDQQLPPTNHERLLDKQTLHNVVASSSPAHLQHPTTAHATMPPPTIAAAMAAALPIHHDLMTPPTHTTPLGSAVAGTDGMITPPRPAPQVIYRSYFERDDDTSEDFSKNAKFLQAAVSRKRAADKEANSFSQVTLYLEAVVYFLLSGAAMEQHRGSEEAAWILYKDTLALIKFISSKFKHLQESSSNGQHETHNKVAILSLRCQSLISLKLYKMKRAFCRSITTVCSNFFKSGKGEIVNGNTPSSISPSNSVCSQGSGSNTPPGKIVPQDIHSALHQQNQYFSYITSSHELWDQADRLVRQGNHTDFFIALDHENGPLTLHSSMYEVFRYVQAGLKKLRDAMSIQ